MIVMRMLSATTPLDHTSANVMMDTLEMERIAQVSYFCNSVKIRKYHLLFYLDNDECSEETHNCDSHAECNNDIGSYNCTCIVGYTGDGFSCG